MQLRLRDAAGKEVEIKAEMTAENRLAIYTARHPAASPASVGSAAPARAERPDPSRRLTPEQAAEDLQVLARAIEDRHSYAEVAGVDAGAALKAASGRLGAEQTVGALAEEIAEALARLGDCHARVRGLSALRPRGFTPFRMEDVGGRVGGGHGDPW